MFLSALNAVMTGAIIAIIIAAIVAVAGIVILAVFMYARKNKPAKEEPVKVKSAKEPVRKTPAEKPAQKEPVKAPATPVEKPPVSVPVSKPAGEVSQPVKKEAAIAAAPAAMARETDKHDDSVQLIVVREGDPVPVIREPLVHAQYNRSYTSRLIQTSEETKEFYSLLKNELISYKKVKSRISWGHESFRLGRNLIAQFVMRGKTLCVCLPIQASAHEDLHCVEDISDIARFEQTPGLIRIKNPRRVRVVTTLFADLLHETVKGEVANIDYTLPYENDQKLLRRGLIKPIKHKKVVITVEEAPQLMNDEEAKANVQVSERFSDKSHFAIVNVDTLSEYFTDGERVTLEEMRERIPYLSKRATYIKVLARGALDKSIEVEADDFSLDAVKMIVLAGGKVYRTRSK